MKRILLAIATMFMVASCGKSTSFTISGHLADENYEGASVYLYDMNETILDSTVIANGAFTLSGDAATPSVVQIFAVSQIGKEYATLILEPGNIYLDLFCDSLSGTPLNDGYYAFMHDAAIQQYKDELSTLQANYYTLDSEAEKKALVHAYDSIEAIYLNAKGDLAEQVLAEHPNDILGALMFYNITQRPSITLAEIESRAKEASPVVSNFAPTQKAINRMRSIEETAVGRHFADFVGTDFASGEKCKFSEMIEGKLALVDFWASWCSPCREEIVNNLIDINAKYADKGLYVIGIDVWDQPEKHRAAVEELGIKYAQLVVDDKKATDAYGIYGIPHIMLIGPDGTILARDLRGSDIEKAVKENL